MRVYIASPYTGDETNNVKKAIKIADKLALLGHHPFIPHLSHFWDLLYTHDYEFWIDQDNSWLEVCDIVLRLPGKSKGADAEVELAKSLGKQIIYGFDPKRFI